MLLSICDQDAHFINGHFTDSLFSGQSCRALSIQVWRRHQKKKSIYSHHQPLFIDFLYPDICRNLEYRDQRPHCFFYLYNYSHWYCIFCKLVHFIEYHRELDFILQSSAQYWRNAAHLRQRVWYWRRAHWPELLFHVHQIFGGLFDYDSYFGRFK